MLLINTAMVSKFFVMDLLNMGLAQSGNSLAHHFEDNFADMA